MFAITCKNFLDCKETITGIPPPPPKKEALDQGFSKNFLEGPDEIPMKPERARTYM